MDETNTSKPLCNIIIIIIIVQVLTHFFIYKRIDLDYEKTHTLATPTTNFIC